MRIAYLAQTPIADEDGVLKKIIDHMTAWQQRGHDVHLFTIGRESGIWEGLRRVPHTPVFYRSTFESFATFTRFRDQVAAWQPDLLYHRFIKAYAGLVQLAERFPLVLEINTDDLPEYRRILPWWIFAYHRLTRKALLAQAAGMVFVTHQLADSPSYQGFPAAKLVLGNGIDLARYPESAPPPPHAPTLVFLYSEMAPWHGLDKLVTLARQCPDWSFLLIGPALPATDLPANIRQCGRLTSKQYLPLLAQADVGISTLALHRKGMSEASPLKTREYLAMGLPVILGYPDTDFPAPQPFLLEIPNAEDNVLPYLDEIRAFVARVAGTRVPHAAIRHLDIQEKEAQRLAFFSTILAKK